MQTGDLITLDVAGRRLHLHVSNEELTNRRAAWKPLELGYDRGYAKLFLNHVLQAHEGVDFDFLRGGSGPVVKRDSH